MQEVAELLSTAYKHSLQTSDLKELFFSQCKPNQLHKLNAERFRVTRDIIESIKVQRTTVKEASQVHAKVEAVFIKEESHAHDEEEMLEEPDISMGSDTEGEEEEDSDSGVYVFLQSYFKNH